MPAKTTKRQGTKRCQCDGCDFVVYVTVAQLEQGCRPGCFTCGGRFVPDDVELAALVIGEQALEPLLERAAIAERAHSRRKRLNGRNGLEIAAEALERDRRAINRKRQLSGLRQFANAAAAAEGMPF